LHRAAKHVCDQFEAGVKEQRSDLANCGISGDITTDPTVTCSCMERLGPSGIGRGCTLSFRMMDQRQTVPHQP
jgi:hypothetical protein